LRKRQDGDFLDDAEMTNEQKSTMDREAAAMAEEFFKDQDWDSDDDDGEEFGMGDDEDYDNPFAAASLELNSEQAADMDVILEDEEDAETEVETTPKGKRGKPKLKQIPVHMLPRVAVIGRPNVGKSALFNRLSGTNAAIVYDTPGVTRDRLYVRGFWGAQEFLLIDTGGLIKPSALESAGLPADLPDHEEDPGTQASAELIPGMIERQAAAAVGEADAVIAVMDGQAGPCASDQDILDWMRRKHPNTPVVLAVNKCESPKDGPIQAMSFWEFGMEPIAISALSGTGTGDLLDMLMEVLPRKADMRDEEMMAEVSREDEPIRVAIVGRPNVGKSSIVNAIVGKERTIVSKISGTTRDAIDTDFEDGAGQKFVLVDTAGIRKRASVAAKSDGAEQLSVKTALKAMGRADIVVLVLDALLGPTEQDFRLAELIGQSGRGCVLCMNKWDLVPKDSTTMVQYEKNLQKRLRNISWAPSVFTTALSGQRVQGVLDAVKYAASEHRRRVSTSTLNMVITDAMIIRQPPIVGGKKGRIYYATQAATRPPTFVLFVNETKLFDETYRRFIERQLREQIGFDGSPLRLLWRGKAKSAQRSTWTKTDGGSSKPNATRNAAQMV